MATTVSGKIFFSMVSYLGIITVPVFFLIFSARFVRFDWWLNKVSIALISVLPFITIIMVSTNKFHKLVWPEVALKFNRIAGIYAIYDHGLWYWINALYCYVLIIFSVSILFISVFQYKNLYSTQTKIILTSSIVPFIVNMVYSFIPSVYRGVEITPVAFTLTGVLLTLAVFKFRLLDFPPTAWETIINNLDEGFLLCDNHFKIININTAFKDILMLRKIKIGEPVNYLFEKYPKIKSLLNGYNVNKKEELIIKKNGKDRHIELNSLFVFDKKNKISFSLLILRDITIQRKIEKELIDSRAVIAEVYNFLPDATFAIDTEGKVIAWNKAMEELTGIKKENMLGRGKYEYAVPFHGRSCPMLINMIFENNEYSKRHYNYIENKGGKIVAEGFSGYLKKNKNIHLWGIASPLYNSNGDIIGAIESIRDITERKVIEDKLKYISFHDILTGLYNRAYFEEEITRLSTSRELPISVIIADVNGLKLLNDVFGHDRGDNLLKQAAEIIKNSCRSSDIIARWGGDEFVILLPETPPEQASEFIERMKEKSKIINYLEIPLSMSMGCATKFDFSTSMHDILKIAENKMYENKLADSKNTQKLIINSISGKLYEKNIITKDLSNNVVRLSLELGNKLNLTDNQIKDLSAVARLHNIGKITIDERILRKKEKLTEEEWDLIRKQSDAGYRIIRASSLLAQVSEYIRSINEWWNGTGYPMGLKGNEIPLISRIISIVNAYETMMTERPYAKPRSREEAMVELKKFSGIQFDPELVKMFLMILE